MKFADRTPWFFRFSRMLIEHQVRGSWRLYQWAERRGKFDAAVWRSTGSRTRVAVPLLNDAIFWSDAGLRGYEQELLDVIAGRMEGLSGATMIDCGAHIGLFSALMLERCLQIRAVVAIEPNEALVPALQQTAAGFPVPAQAIGAAVSDFAGTGRLERAPYFEGDVAMFLVRGDGPVRVITVDSLAISNQPLLLKIDVEGGELEVIAGAASTIRSAPGCVIVLEAHPQVSRRTGRDPMNCVRLLETIRPFEYRIAETGAAVMPQTERLFEETDGGDKPWNIVARSLRMPPG